MQSVSSWWIENQKRALTNEALLQITIYNGANSYIYTKDTILSYHCEASVSIINEELPRTQVSFCLSLTKAQINISNARNLLKVGNRIYVQYGFYNDLNVGEYISGGYYYISSIDYDKYNKQFSIVAKDRLSNYTNTFYQAHNRINTPASLTTWTITLETIQTILNRIMSSSDYDFPTASSFNNSAYTPLQTEAEVMQSIASATGKILTTKKNDKFYFNDLSWSMPSTLNYFVEPDIQTKDIVEEVEEQIGAIYFNVSQPNANNINSTSFLKEENAIKGYFDANGHAVLNLGKCIYPIGTDNPYSFFANDLGYAFGGSDFKLWNNVIELNKPSQAGNTISVWISNDDATYRNYFAESNFVSATASIEINSTGEKITIENTAFLKDNFNTFRVPYQNWANHRKIINIQCRIDPRLDLLDKIIAVSSYGDLYRAIVEEYTIDFQGGFFGTIKARCITDYIISPNKGGSGFYQEDDDWYFKVQNSNPIPCTLYIATSSGIQAPIQLEPNGIAMITKLSNPELTDYVEALMQGLSVDNIELYLQNNEAYSDSTFVGEDWFE